MIAGRFSVWFPAIAGYYFQIFGIVQNPTKDFHGFPQKT